MTQEMTGLWDGSVISWTIWKQSASRSSTNSTMVRDLKFYKTKYVDVTANTLATSTIFVVASASSLAALRSLDRDSASDVDSASIFSALISCAVDYKHVIISKQTNFFTRYLTQRDFSNLLSQMIWSLKTDAERCKHSSFYQHTAFKECKKYTHCYCINHTSGWKCHWTAVKWAEKMEPAFQMTATLSQDSVRMWFKLPL